MGLKLTNAVFVLACAAALTACGPKKVPLPGERLSVRTPIGPDARPAPTPDIAPHHVALRLPAPRLNADWPQRNGGAAHRITQPALNTALTPLWTVSIGQGDDKRHHITADPVVASGRIYAMDSEAGVSAVSPEGKLLWQTDITPPGGRKGAVSGGGLAYGDGTLFASSSFGELVALDPATGKLLWRQAFDSPVAGAPTVAGKTVYVVTRGAVGYALNTANGRIRWDFQGTPSIGGLTGGASPAVSGGMAVFPFTSDEMVATKADGGAVMWTSNVAGRRLGKVYAEIPDIAGDPVIEGGTVYVGNATGEVGAYDLTSGEASWTSPEGTMGPIWPVGGALYFVSDEAKLVRLNAASGAVVWKADLPYYEPYRKDKHRRDIFVNFGPLLAGNRLIVPSSDGNFRLFDPASGKLVATRPIGAGATTDAAVARGVLYIVTTDGKLRAFR